MSNGELRELVASLLVAQKETDRQLKDTDRQMKETDRKLDRIMGHFGNQWGLMVEALVEPGCLQLFRARNIDVSQVLRRVESERAGQFVEFDLVLVNGKEVVVLEAKSVFTTNDVRNFLRRLALFRDAFPQYASYRTLGGVAAMRFAGETDRFAHRQGLFVLRFTGGLMEIANPLNFRPKAF